MLLSIYLDVAFKIKIQQPVTYPTFKRRSIIILFEPVFVVLKQQELKDAFNQEA